MRSGHGWKCAELKNIPPTKSSFMRGWHSVRHFLGITAFGINAVSADKAGDVLIKPHDEKKSNQQEVFFVSAGLAEFKIDDEICQAAAGTFVAIEPQCNRAVIALQAGTEVIVIGSPVGRLYQIPNWDKLD